MFGFGHAEHVKRLLESVPGVLEEDADSSTRDPVEFQEYLAWARYVKCSILEELWSAFEETSTNGVLADEDELQRAMRQLDYSLSRVAISKSVEAKELSMPLDFEHFVIFYDRCRKPKRQSPPAYICFTGDETDILKGLFKAYAKGSTVNGTLEPGQLILLLTDLRVPMNTLTARQQVFELLEQARLTATKQCSEADQLDKHGNNVTYRDLLHLTRAIIRVNEKTQIEREEQAIAETNFNGNEIAELRAIFADWQPRSRRTRSKGLPATEPGKVVPTSELGRRRSMSNSEPVRASSAAEESAFHMPLGRRHSTPDIQNEGRLNSKGLLDFGDQRKHSAEDDEEAPTVTAESLVSGRICRICLKGFLQVVGSLGARVSETGRQGLVAKADSLTGGDPQGLDFADFLRLFRWVLDGKCGGIKQFPAKKMVDNSRKHSP
eukprot:gnl/TRDRNA2_/TRDRNA2_174304_c0_seq5.p1 gnl/TRDRNA2_/TRDRNA2_174304_c0~~gnl/TRDRNA2_/TRDRNA2_174304_c0_seq5.p1  ORF type:complete len:470 (-),score=79.37 gnl/TRDRNA2_/TRDRNA2_174304_c0_seq5:620-1927(-)